jgi:aconitate hydratase
VRANYLMSPPLVVAFAIAGRIDVDLDVDPLGVGADGAPVFLRDVWPSPDDVQAVLDTCIEPSMYTAAYAHVLEGDAAWAALAVPESERYAWEADSTYVRSPPYFEGMPREAPANVPEIRRARVLAVLGDSVTTDHISPAGAIPAAAPAGQWLLGRGVPPADFNSYGARRGNHEVMVRGTLANLRIRNRLVPGTEGGYTRYHGTGEQMSIYDATCRYQADGTALIVLAGTEYGAGSSRDWAAKGPLLQGVRAVIAESFERIHRSNLVGMGILPLQFLAGESAAAHGLTGHETFDIEGLGSVQPGAKIQIKATTADGQTRAITLQSRIDTPNEVEYFKHGGILPYVLRQLI